MKTSDPTEAWEAKLEIMTGRTTNPFLYIFHQSVPLIEIIFELGSCLFRLRSKHYLSYPVTSASIREL